MACPWAVLLARTGQGGRRPVFRALPILCLVVLGSGCAALIELPTTIVTTAANAVTSTVTTLSGTLTGATGQMFGALGQ